MTITVVRWFVLATILAVMSAGVAPALPGDDPDVRPAEGRELEAEAAELMESIDDNWSKLRSLESQIDGARGDESVALRERGSKILTEFMADLDALAENTVAREEAGLDVSETRDSLSDVMWALATFLQQTAVSFETEGKELNRALDEAEAADRAEIREAIDTADHWYGTALSFLVDETRAMEDFDLDTSEQRDFLTDHLRQRADLIAGRILVARDGVARTSRLASVDPTNTEIAADLDAANAKLDSLVVKLEGAVGTMEKVDLDVADYQRLIFEVTGEITSDLLDREVMGGLAKSWFRSGTEWLTSNGPALVFKALLFVLILVAFKLLSGLARKVVRRAMKASKIEVSQLLERTALSLTGTLVMIFGILVALSQVGVEVAPLLAGLGVAGFIIGFALQDTLGNFASGIMILLYRPYDVGDLVEASGVTGKVKDMSLVSTTILTLDNQTLIIPNSKIWGDVIKNITAQTMRRVDMVFGIGYADDIPHAEKVLTEIVEAHEKVLADPVPNVKLHTLGESSVDFVVRPWVATDDYWDVYWDITREVKLRFDAEGISIPFPQRDVHVFSEGEES